MKNLLVCFLVLFLVCVWMPLVAMAEVRLIMTYSPFPGSPGSSFTFNAYVYVMGDPSPAGGQTVTFSVSPDDGSVSLSPTSATTVANEPASTTLSTGSGSSGVYTVAATTGNKSASGMATVETPPRVPEFSISVVNGPKSGDPGDALTFSVNPDAAAVLLDPIGLTANGNGLAKAAPIPLSGVTGSYTITVTIGDESASGTVTVEAPAPELEPTSLVSISGDNQEGVVGKALANPFVVEVRDQNGSPLEGITVTFAVTSGGGELSAGSVTTNANGRAESTLTLGPNPGTNIVTVSVTGIQEEETFTAEGIRIPKTFEIISGDDQQGLPGAALTHPFVVKVLDDENRPVPGVQVTFSVASGGGTLSAGSVTTDANGRAQSTLILGTNPGPNTVSVSVTGIQQEKTFNAEGIRIPRAFWIISGIDQQGVIGEALAHPFIVEVRGQSGEPFPGAQVMFVVAAGGGTLSVTSAMTDTDGRAESILTLGPNPGRNTVTVSVTGIAEEQSVSATAEPPPIPEDVNGDDVVNILDLVSVASNLGDEGVDLAADVNGDGIVNILDLVMVAGALGNTAAAPSSDPRALAMLTAADVRGWLAQAQTLDLTDATTQTGVLALEQLAAVLTPERTALLPNYPNPFNPETWIPYQLSRDAEVALTVYDANGFMVRRLELGHQLVGYYSDRGKAVHWDGRNHLGESVASGVYFYHLTAGDYSATRKMLILK